MQLPSVLVLRSEMQNSGLLCLYSTLKAMTVVNEDTDGSVTRGGYAQRRM